MVFQCDKHGECTVAKKLPGIQVCDGCPPVQKQPAAASTRTWVPTGKAQAATLVDSVSTNTKVVRVRLDDGRQVLAAVASRFKKRSGIRCVVVTQDNKWSLIQ